MKKILSFLFIGLLVLLVVGCKMGKSYSITISDADANITLTEGETKQVSVTFEGDGVVWKSANESVAVVTDGLITALKEGTAVITVAVKDHEDVKATISVTVKKATVEVTAVAIAGKRTEVEVDTEFNLSVVVTPSAAGDQAITWASSDPTVASVDNGKVKALKVGTTEISATVGGKTDKFNLTVKEKAPDNVLATFITIDEGKVLFHIGETDTAYAEIDPDATDQTIVWSTSDSNVITIDENGLITAVGGGKADVIATTHDGTDLSDSYKVVVYADVTEMTITGEATMPLNGTQKLNVTVNSDSASTLTWSSSDPETATVVATTGFVTALKEGTVKIKCKSDDRTGMEKEFEITITEIVATAITIKGERGMSPSTTQTLVAKANVDSNPSFKWTSSDPETATVTDEGLVTALKEGKVTISCEVQDSGKLTVKYEITIADKSVKIGETSYNTITEAIAAAKDGDVIVIGFGTYDEALNINKDNLTFKGPNSGIPGFLDRRPEAILSAAISVTGNNIVFDGLKMTGAGAVTLGKKDSTDVVDNVLFTCCYIDATPISAEGCNRYGSVVNASAVANITFEKTYMNCGTNTGQRSNIAMAQKLTNLTIHDCVLHQDATSGGTCEAIMTYNVDGRFEITSSTIENTTTNFLIQLGYNANTCSYVLIKDNVWSAKDKTLDTSGFNLKNMLEDTKIDFIHNYIYNAKGNTFSFANNKDTSVVNVMFNYFNEGTAHKVTSKGNGTLNYENNFYAAAQTTATTDAGVVKSLEELEALYAKWNAANGYYLPAGATTDENIVTVGAEGCDYTTLDAAIEAATGPTTINLVAGTYELGKALNQQFTIVGTSASEVLINVKAGTANNLASDYIKFQNVTLKGTSSNGAGVYFQATADTKKLIFDGVIVNTMNTFVKVQAGTDATYIFKDCEISGIGQFIIWAASGTKEVYFINNKVDVASCSGIVNTASTLLRVRSGSCYVYGNYFTGTGESGDGMFENGASDNEYLVKYNTFENCERFVHDNGHKPITFDYNLYLDATKEALSEAPSAVAPEGYGVTKDEHVMTSDDERATAYQEVTVDFDSYSISYDLAGGECDNLITSYKTGDGIVLPVPTKELNKFAGWLNGEDVLFKLPYNAKGNFNLVAKWELDAPTHNITYDTDGGTLPTNAQDWYMEEVGLATLPAPTRYGFDFLGWFDGETEVTSISGELKVDVSLKAHWEEKAKHTITYNLDGGSLPTDAKENYYEGIGLEELPTPTKEGSVFFGWYLTSDFSGDEVTNISSTDDSDVIIYAKWILESATYAIHFNLNKGSLLYPTRAALVQAFVDDYSTVLNKGYKNYRDIKEGSFEDCDYHLAFEKTLPDGTTFYAKWKWLAEYLLVLSERDLASNNCNVLGLKDVIDDGVVSRSGDNLYGLSYAFRAFLLGTTIRPDSSYTSVDFSNEENANGYWAKLSEFENPTWTHLYGETKLPTPYYSTYSFAGWFRSADFSGDAVTTLSGETGTVELYAKYGETNEVTAVSFNENVTELKRYETKQLTWTITPENADVKSVVFASSNPSVVTISDKGLLTAVSVGTAKITMTSKSVSGKSVSFDVTVYSPDHFDVSYETTSYVEPTKTIKLNASYVKRDGTNGTITWSSADPTIATVADGVVTGVAAGYTTIKASVSETEFFEFTVTVVENASDIIKYLLESHNSNLFTHYDLGIGAGKPAYYRDIIGSVSDTLFNNPLVINTDYEAKQATHSDNHGGVKSSTEFITVHYTGNMSAGSWASANANYFANNASTSIHYVTGSDGVYHVLDDQYVGFHAGDGTGVTFTWTKTGVQWSENDPKWPVWGISANSKFTINGKETSISVPTGTSSATTKVTDARWINDMGLAFKVVNGEYYMGTTWWCYSQVAEGRICNKGGNNNSIGIESAVNPEGDLWYTWHKTAQLVAKLMLDNNLDITRVVGHHFYTAKDCPQPLLENDLEIWWEFIDMVEAEYELLTTFKDYTFTLEIVSDPTGAALTSEANGGRTFFTTANGCVEQKEAASSITYKVTVTKASDPNFKEEIVLGSVVGGIYSK